jgi:hypothetical protein
MAYNVPNVAGVPQLLGGLVSYATGALSNALSDIAGLPISAGPQWGIFLNGQPVVVADVIMSIEFRGESVIADFPIEGGGFRSYDKVKRPWDVRFRFAAGGSQANKQALINSVEAIADDYKLYTFVSPEHVLQNINIAHRDYHRTATSGAGLLQEDVWGWQIQIDTSSGVSSTQASNPASADQASGGEVQTVVPASSGTGNFTDGSTLNGASQGAALGVPQIGAIGSGNISSGISGWSTINSTTPGSAVVSGM